MSDDTFQELVSSGTWKKMYDRCFDQWKLGLYQLRATDPTDVGAIAEGQARMTAAEEILQLPVKGVASTREQKEAYNQKVEKGKERILREAFEEE